MTIKEWLEGLAQKNTSTDEDSSAMQALLRHRLGFPQAVVVVGIVYPEGSGHPIDIHSISRMILKQAFA